MRTCSLKPNLSLDPWEPFNLRNVRGWLLRSFKITPSPFCLTNNEPSMIKPYIIGCLVQPPTPWNPPPPPLPPPQWMTHSTPPPPALSQSQGTQTCASFHRPIGWLLRGVKCEYLWTFFWFRLSQDIQQSARSDSVGSRPCYQVRRWRHFGLLGLSQGLLEWREVVKRAEHQIQWLADQLNCPTHVNPTTSNNHLFQTLPGKNQESNIQVHTHPHSQGFQFGIWTW